MGKEAEVNKNRFWCSFVVPTDDCRPMTSPPHAAVLGWWLAGHTGEHGYPVIRAVVQAGSEAVVRRVIAREWPAVVDFRFCHKVVDDFVPDSRFALSDWMAERLGSRKQESVTMPVGELIFNKPSDRRIKQISAIGVDNTINTQCDGAVVALCEDGSLWMMPLFQTPSPRGTRQEWARLPAIPTETTEPSNG